MEGVGQASGTVEAAALQLLKAAATGVPCPPIRDLIRQDVEEAYHVQRVLLEVSILSGRKLVGRKVGLTAPAVQQQLGVDSPDFGYLFEDMRFKSGERIPIERLMQPRVEAEIAFVVDTRITSTDDEEIVAAIGGALPAFEIVDSRIADWNIRLVDTVADNASSGLFVIGNNRVPISQVRLPEVEMTMTDGAGQVVSSGRGAACLGDPLRAVSWVAKTSIAQGRPLEPGDVILAGALGPMVPVRGGESFAADFTGIGKVGVSF